MGDIDAELRALAGSTANAFTVRHGDRTVNVSYRTDNDDDITGLAFWIAYDEVARSQSQAYRDAKPREGQRPMEIELRPENADDFIAKARGVSTEWQSGDAVFDEKVYVDSPITDTSLLGLVVGPEARAGVLELLALGFDSVVIDNDNGNVVASLPSAKFGSTLETPALRALNAFERLLSRLPAVTPSATKQRASTLGLVANIVLIAAGAVGWCLNVGYAGGLMFLVEAIRGHDVVVTPEMVLGAIVIGLVGGGVFAWFWRTIAVRRARGASNAHKRARWATIIGFAGFSVIAFTAALLVLLANADLRK